MTELHEIEEEPGAEMMADQSECLFVYGTLMPGHINHGRIAGHVQSAHPATIKGILIDLGKFPALVRGDGMVRGILLSIGPPALEITDFIEGFHTDNREQSLYVREKIQVELGDGEIVEAWTYFVAHPHRFKDRPHLTVDDADGIPVYSWPRE